ncbi:MAG: DUF1461 domain-containing protein [Clostridiales bacterium]|nr:DUF1461 domain-containing protein [Clostridiales bacterium]
MVTRALGFAAGAAGAVGAFAFVLAVLGVSLHVLLVPAYTRVLVLAVGAPELAGLPSEETLVLAEQVRAHVAGEPNVELPGTLPDGRAAFGERAVAHLDDVRDVIARARLAMWVAIAIAVAWVTWGLTGLQARRMRALARSMRWAALALAGPLGVAALAMIADFDRAFTIFHALFFEGDTWLFPLGELLIELFPLPFWIVSGASWGALVALGAVILGVTARQVRARVGTGDASQV